MTNITIDIGNSSIMLCAFKNEIIFKSMKLDVSKFDEQKLINFIILLYSKDSKSNVLISSVVPNITDNIIKLLNSKNIKYFLARDLIKLCKLKINLANQKQIGDDRLINVIFAKYLYKKSIIVIDFGTATTIDVLDQDGVYDGGVITPGIDLSLKSLKDFTAKLPLVKFQKINSVVGKNTKKAIQSGFYWGYISMIQGLVQRIENEKRDSFRIVLTGGNTKYFEDCFKKVVKIDELFNSKGLNFIINSYLKKIP